MSMGLHFAQRAELALRQDMRLEQRLEMSVRLSLRQHELMGTEDVDDPLRVRHFGIGSGRGRIGVIAKLVTPAHGVDPYLEAQKLEMFRAAGFAAPELMGVIESNNRHYIITRFVDDVANLATLMKNTSSRDKFFDVSGVVLNQAFLDIVLQDMPTVDQLNLLEHVVEHMPAKVKKALSEEIEQAKSVLLPEELAVGALKKIILANSVSLQTLPAKKSDLIVRTIGKKIGRALGEELARLHARGVIKHDFLPRNLLVKLAEDTVALMHTGFNAVDFVDAPLEKAKRLANLQEVGEHFDAADVPQSFKKAFLAGYFGRPEPDSVAVVDAKSDTNEHVVVEPEVVATRSRLTRLLAGTKYQHGEPTEVVVAPSVARVKTALENVIAHLPMNQLNLHAILVRWEDIIQNVLAQTTPTYQEMRVHKMILYIFHMMKEGEEVSLRMFEDTDDEEIRMEQSLASRLLAPAFEKLGIPSIQEAMHMLRLGIVLRFVEENLTASDEELTTIIANSGFNDHEGESLGINSRRTVTKYVTELKSLGKVALTAKDRRKVISCFEVAIATGDVVETNSIAAKVGLPPEPVSIVLGILKQKYLFGRVKELVLAGQEVDVIDLGTRLGVEYDLIERMTDDVRKTMPAQIPATVAAVRSEVALALPVEEVEPVRTREEIIAAMVPTDFVQPTVVATPVIAVPSVQVEPPIQSPEQPSRDHIIDRITADVVYPTASLANELGMSVAAVESLIQAIYDDWGLSARSREVLALIMAPGGIEDDGIQARTGLSVTEIHFVVRPLLLRGQIRPGRPDGR